MALELCVSDENKPLLLDNPDFIPYLVDALLLDPDHPRAGMKQELKSWCQEHHVECLAQLAVFEPAREALRQDPSVIPALEAVAEAASALPLPEASVGIWRVGGPSLGPKGRRRCWPYHSKKRCSTYKWASKNNHPEAQLNQQKSRSLVGSLFPWPRVQCARTVLPKAPANVSGVPTMNYQEEAHVFTRVRRLATHPCAFYGD